MRDYGTAGQLGLERTPEEYIAKMVAIFREVRRVLRDDGTLWLNLGDSYSSDTKGSGGASDKQDSNAGSRYGAHKIESGLKPKDLCGIPWMLAFALRADGWYLRQDIIWAKPNPMPESVTDRCTKSHEYIFLLSKKAKYYYDAEAVKEKSIYAECDGGTQRFGTPNGKAEAEYGYLTSGEVWTSNGSRNRRSVWHIATAPFSGAHFATFPPKLVEPCILAGTSERGQCPKCGKAWERVTKPTDEYAKKLGTWTPDTDADPQLRAEIGFAAHGKKDSCCAEYTTLGWQPTCKCDAGEPVPQIVLDPFFGAGTTGLVASQHLRRYIGIELNETYVEMARKRIEQDAPLFGEAV